jgi:hypothetical protein
VYLVRARPCGRAICRWIHAWVPRVEAGMYYEARGLRKHFMLS